MEHRASKYECVRKFPILKGYLEHFKEVSKNNEIPGLISFFYILGQAAIPYVRVPVGGSNLDPKGEYLLDSRYEDRVSQRRTKSLRRC